jgi:hypothetical protein
MPATRLTVKTHQKPGKSYMGLNAKASSMPVPAAFLRQTYFINPFLHLPGKREKGSAQVSVAPLCSKCTCLYMPE